MVMHWAVKNNLKIKVTFYFFILLIKNFILTKSCTIFGERVFFESLYKKYLITKRIIFNIPQ